MPARWQQTSIAVVTSQLFAENCFIAHLHGRTDCLVFDPGFDAHEIVAHLERHQLTPAVILNTHGHTDHIVGNGALKERWPTCPLVIGVGDAPKLTDPRLNLSAQYGVPITSPPADAVVHDGEIFEAAGFRLEVHEIPGHSCGHVVFVWKGDSPWTVFGGDVLFRRSIGRSDFPDGDPELLVRGIREKLFTLPDDTIVLPGHGPQTTIGFERRENPFVGE